MSSECCFYNPGDAIRGLTSRRRCRARESVKNQIARLLVGTRRWSLRSRMSHQRPGPVKFPLKQLRPFINIRGIRRLGMITEGKNLDGTNQSFEQLPVVWKKRLEPGINCPSKCMVYNRYNPFFAKELLDLGPPPSTNFKENKCRMGVAKLKWDAFSN